MHFLVKMGAVEELFRTIGELLLKLLEALWDGFTWLFIKFSQGLALTMGFISLLNPIYTYEGFNVIFISSSNDDDDDNIYWRCVLSLFYSIHSLMCTMVTPMLLLNPLRWSAAIALVQKRDEPTENRMLWLMHAFAIVPDYIFFFVALLGLLRPSLGGPLLIQFT